MPTLTNFQSFEELFEKINLKKGKEGRTVYSPAAYLSDLLQLMEDRFGESNGFFDRRSDVKDIPLNGENAFTQVAYLDIVNRILEHKISEKSGKDAYEAIKSARYPFHLPFHLEEEKFNKYLHFLGADETQLYRLFSRNPDNERIARSYLQLSQEEINSILDIPTAAKAFFKGHFGLEKGYVKTLSNLESFLKVTGLSRLELNELLFQNLSSTAVSGEQTELSLANQYYLNQGTTGYVTLDPEETTILWGYTPDTLGEGGEVIKEGTFTKEGMLRLQRASQLIRLAQQTGISISEAQLMLRNCCNNVLNSKTFERLAVIRFLQDKYELDLDVCCALISGMNHQGIGNGDQPTDLFNRVYNNDFTSFDEKYIPGSNFIPAPFRLLEEYKLNSDILAAENHALLQRIAKALQMSVKGITQVVQQFRLHFGVERSEANVFHENSTDLRAMLTLLYRISQLTTILDISHRELFHIFDVLEKDPSVRQFSQFSALVYENIDESDAYLIIQEKTETPVSANLWLVQTLIGLNAWMQENDFTGLELKQILTGKGLTEKEAQLLQKQKLDFLNQLYQQLEQVFFKADLFRSDSFDLRDSRSIYRTICRKEQGLTSKKDKRLIHFDEQKAQMAANQAVDQLDSFTPEDFRDLGLSEKMVDKIFNNLLIKGYINAEGTLSESAFPADASAFHINDSSTSEQEQLFETIHQLVKESYGGNGSFSADNGTELALFPSDLEELELEEPRMTELYDNLIFNGYLDEEGNLRQPEFFSKSENATQFKPNANIDHYSAAVYRAIKKQTDCYFEEDLMLTADTFADLPLADVEKNDLLENLRFNGYLKENNAIADKNFLLEVPASELNISLQFYRHHREILSAIQEKIAMFKANYFTISKEMLSEISEEIVADVIFNKLQENYLDQGLMTPEGLAFFREEENLTNFTVSPYFSEINHQTIFKFIRQTLANLEKYQFQISELENLGLEEEFQEEIMEMLSEQGFLRNGKIAPEKRSYLLNINNVLTFDLEGFTDFNKDIFYLLHDITKTTEANVQEIVEVVRAAAEDQETTLLSALAEYVEIPEDSTEVLLRHFFINEQNLVERMVLPVLETVDAKGRIKQLPSNNTFNFVLQRLRQSALLVSKLRLNGQETEVAFSEQSLVEKFPEKLHLPAGLDRFDALLEMEDLIYLFRENRYWTYSRNGYTLQESGLELQQLSEKLAGLTQVDAAFTDASGKAWIIGRTLFIGEGDMSTAAAYFCKKQGSDEWEVFEKQIGRMDSNFTDPERIDASFIDPEGKAYLFSGDQYMRYSEDMVADEGYPKTIEDNWKNELDFDLPVAFQESIDASFTDLEGVSYFFNEGKFISSEDNETQRDINQYWGKVRNNFTNADRVDAAFVYQDTVYFFSGNQLIAYSDSIENDEVYGVTGSLRDLRSVVPGLPISFENGINSVLDGTDDQYYVFKDRQFVQLNQELESEGEGSEIQLVSQKWGLVKNNLRNTGQVDAALAGLDGRTYLFSGDQYYRYSKADYSKVDEGYPRSITEWGGLSSVDAAFVLDGKTYLFGKTQDQAAAYVQYSTNEYATPDEGFPKSIDDNWWNLPENLLHFDSPDAIFVGNDGNTYLFQDNKFVYFDQQHRWWSEPEPIRQRWDSLPFKRIAAAFTGKDGRTYIFEQTPQREETARNRKKKSALHFVRYSDPNYNKIDDRFPKITNEFWGNVMNNIEKSGKIDASVSLLSRIPVLDENGEATTELREEQHTYLFSGNQFFRYTGNNYDFVDEGYPKTIRTALKAEPRFQNLDFDLSNGIDAIFADQRNVYLFKQNQWQVVSEVSNKVYSQLSNSDFHGTIMDNGHIYTQLEGNWMRLNAIENKMFTASPEMPRVLSSLPEEFTKKIDTILKGLDNNTYVFREGHCYNLSLEKHYPLGEEWGITENNIQTDHTLDAAFLGRDGKTYLFSGDQFVSYTPIEGQTAIPEFMDNQPLLISRHWGGLENVAVAFVKDEKTYVMEAPNEEGVFRYHCYSTEDYSQPDTKDPLEGDWHWWEMPEEYLEQGFDRVHAVLFEGDNMFLLDGNSFVQFDQSENIWTYPKPLDRIWRNLPMDNSRFEYVKTAFTGKDGVTRFFSENHFVEYNNRIQKIGDATFWSIHPIQARWGLADNNFIRNNAIHASVVVDQKYTFLFSGDQYVRYSGADYRFVDEGYPKDVLGNLRKEKGFTLLTEAQEQLISKAQTLGGIIANEYNLYVFAQQNCHVISQQLHRNYALNHLGHLRNNIAKDNQIDAAFISQWDHAYLFSGDQYVKYSSSDYSYVDQGYPKSITKDLPGELGLDLSNIKVDQVDAIFRGPDDQVYLFKDKNFITDSETTVVQPINSVWTVSDNPFAETNREALPLIDAAFTAPNGQSYFFKGHQFVRYSSLNQEFVDEGYPKRIKDNWGDLFPGSRNGSGDGQDFEAQIDLAFTLEGNTYFSKGANYVRFSNSDFTKMDEIAPRSFSKQWVDRNDFMLNDLQLISRYKRLNDQYQQADSALTDFFIADNAYVKDPFQLLAQLFDWNLDEIKWLKQRNVFLKPENDVEVHFGFEQITAMYDTFKLSNKLQLPPSALYEKVWLEKYNRNNVEKAAEVLYKQLGLINTEQEWSILSRQIHDEMNLLRRDALLPYLVYLTEGVEDERDLFEHLLVDVEMGSDAKTSNIKEATAAAQLYFHRYFVNLEELNNSDQDKKTELKHWWEWMKNYRVWEANRKVFLYPENYIRPELRDTKTGEFEKLEDGLLAGIINRENVERNFKQYLDTFATVGNLKVAGANIYEDGEEDVLILFGFTRTEPAIYYYRTARFANDAIEWGAWEKTELIINSDRVFPLYANGRLLVFWVEIEEFEDSAGTLGRKNDDSEFLEVNTSNTSIRHRAHVMYSYIDLNNQWSPPQRIKRNIELNYKLDAAYMEPNGQGKAELRVFSGEFCSNSSLKNPGGDIKRIEEYDEYKILARYGFHTGIDAVTVFKGKRYYFKGKLCLIQRVSDNKILTYTYISNLIRPPKGESPEILIVSFNHLGVGATRAVSIKNKKADKGYVIPNFFDAAFDIEDKVLCLIDKAGKYTFYELKVDAKTKAEYLAPVQTLATISSKFGNSTFNFEFFIQTIANKGGQFAPADGVFKEDNNYFILRNGMYECYRIDEKGLLDPVEGYPKPIRGNLSFNMDNFFNQLYMVYHDRDGGYTSVNYTTAKGDLLLSGKLKSNFTFEETEFRNNLSLSRLNSWKRKIANFNNEKFNEELHLNVETLAKEIKTEANSLKQKSDKLHQIKTGLNYLIDGLSKFSTGDEETFIASLNNAGESLKVIGNADDTAFRNLKSRRLELKNTYDQWKATDEEDRESLGEEIVQKASALLSYIKGDVKGVFDAQDTQLNNEVDALHPKFDNSNYPEDNNDQYDNIKGHFIRIASDLSGLQKFLDIKEAIINQDNFNKLAAEQDQLISQITSFHSAVLTALNNAKNTNTGSKNGLDTLKKNLNKVVKEIDAFLAELTKGRDTSKKLLETQNKWIEQFSSILDSERERVFGRFDLFHKDTKFNIQTRSNFSFGTGVDWYIFEAKNGSFVCRPLGKSESDQYEIIRLTTNTIPDLNQRLFAKGIEGLLDLKTQQIDESPAFGKDMAIPYNKDRVPKVPVSANLDFRGANSVYYWEIFFHAPFLIAQALNTDQKFAEAKAWYEFIFDPTNREQVWRFLPFADENLERAFISDPNQLRKYYNDPFDPHAIAGLRINAYRKAIVMNYIDNLLDWGDMLFRQYTMESINEARMLYILAYDLLGKRPEPTGERILSKDQTYAEQKVVDSIDLEIWDLENEEITGESEESEELVNQTPAILTIHDSNLSAYFFIPENDLFLEYWDRVEDRLYKIRHSLNIKGLKQALPLFQPPIDPAALVLAASSGAGIAQAMGSINVAVPHYRFSFMINKAKELVDKLNQFGGELLGTLEKKDGEELSRLQSRQEGIILKMSRGLRESQLIEAGNNLKALNQSLEDANWRLQYHKDTIAEGYLPAEEGQIAMMTGAVLGHTVASVFNILGAILYPWPDTTIGLFSFGATVDTGDIGEGMSKIGEAAASVSEGLSILGELSGMVAQQQRMQEDWSFQKETTEHEIAQITLEIKGAELQQKMAQLELEIYEKELEQQASIQTFYKEKFSNQELYQWMTGRLSSLYFQTYKLAFDMAKYAEKAFQFERGLKATEASFINGNYWDSQRKGLLAGESLGLDLDRMEKAFIEQNERRLEIAKDISLVELDPVAYLNLLRKGTCEFRLSEALFDYDFQGHYCRQIKTITLTIDAGEGKTVNATLTQLNHRTIMEADPKAVKYLLDPKDQQPLSIRSNWKANQQIAISHVGDYEDSNGLFELRFDDERYLPFEGTGAVSTWRLELSGKRGSYQLKDIKNVVINVKYTALQGGEKFADAVRGMLKPYPTALLIDVANEFPNEWNNFVGNGSNELKLPLTRDHFPNMSSSKVTGMMAKFELAEESTVQMTVNGDDSLVLRDAKYLETPGLAIRNRGTEVAFTLKGKKENLSNMKLVLGYKAQV